MRRPLIAGNWKMNLDRAGAVALAKAVVAKAGEFQPSTCWSARRLCISMRWPACCAAAGGAGCPEHVLRGQWRLHRRDQRRDAGRIWAAGT